MEIDDFNNIIAWVCPFVLLIELKPGLLSGFTLLILSPQDPKLLLSTMEKRLKINIAD